MKDAGNTLKKARKLNFKNRNKRINESIGGEGDFTDIFRFNARSSTINITARRLGNKPEVELYRVDQKLGKTLRKIGKTEFSAVRSKQRDRFLSSVDLSSTGGKNNKTYTADVEKGNFVLVVSNTARNSRKYNLRFVASPLDTIVSSVSGVLGDGNTTNPVNTSNDGASGSLPDSTNGGTTVSGTVNTPGANSPGSGANSPGSGANGTGSADSTSGTSPVTSNSGTSWVRQLGSGSNDYGYATAVDASGNVYLAGTASGTLPGIGASDGSQDNFVAKYDATGQLLWTRQFHFDSNRPNYDDTIFDIEVDDAGNYYIAGITANIPNSLSLNNLGEYDADGFVAKYDSDGNQLWRNVIETNNDTVSYNIFTSSVNVHKFDAASSLAIGPDGSIYVGGFLESIPNVTFLLGSINSNPSQGFIAKYNENTGQEVWLTTIGGNKSDAVSGLEVGADGSIYTTGIQDATIRTIDILSGDFEAIINAPFIGGDAFVAKHQENGAGNGATALWSKSLVSTDNQQDYGRAIAIDSSSNVYITGDTSGTLPEQRSAGGTDGFAAKYDTNGNQQWVQQFGTTAEEESQAIAVNSTGNVYVAGESGGNLYGSNVGADDIWIATYDTNGSLTGSTQFGTPQAEEPYRMMVDSADNIYLVGQTLGSLAAPNAHQGLFDAVILKNPTI